MSYDKQGTADQALLKYAWPETVRRNIAASKTYRYIVLFQNQPQ